MDQHWPESLLLKPRRTVKLRIPWLQAIASVLLVLVLSTPAVPLILLVENKVARRPVLINLFGTPGTAVPALASALELSNLTLQIVRQDAFLLPVVLTPEEVYSEDSNIQDKNATIGTALSVKVDDSMMSGLGIAPVPEAAGWECLLPVDLNWKGVLQLAASNAFDRRGQNHRKLAVKVPSSFHYRRHFQNTNGVNFRRIWD